MGVHRASFRNVFRLNTGADYKSYGLAASVSCRRKTVRGFAE